MAFEITIIAAALLCSLVAGFLGAFAVVAMPGIKKLKDYEFLQAFRMMDGVIQQNQPVFMVVWIGSVVAVVAASVLGYSNLEGVNLFIMMMALLIYLLGVQLPTGTINIPLNNMLQRLDIGRLSTTELADARFNFEPRWNRWNIVRTVCATITALFLLILLLRI